MPPNRFESEVESFLEGSHGDRTHIKRADHHTVTPLCGTLLTRRIKAIFWWCYMHTENPLPPAQILKIMPTDTQIEAQWEHASRTHPAAGVIPRWGDAIAWHDLHHTSPHRNNWD